MSKPRYSIEQAIDDCVNGLKNSDDRSATTIRCMINDALDAADRDGMAVNFGYNQTRAIAKVKAALAVLDKY